MKSKIINLTITGCMGRMGQQLIKASKKTKGYSLYSLTEYKKINNNEKILVIDDLIATGGTAEAAAKLIEISGGTVAGFIFVINLFDLQGNDLLKKKGYKAESLIEFPGH